MSAIYPDLTSPFPNSVDLYRIFTDVTASTKPLVEQYYTYINSSNFTAANQLLIDNPILHQIIINSDTMQTIYDSLVALERFVTEETFVNKVSAIVKDKGDWSASVQYQLFNIVYYNGKSYIVSNNTGEIPPIGTLPTNESYYRLITIVGTSGTGLTFRGGWTSNTPYYYEDTVINGNKLYVCMEDHTSSVGNPPSSLPDMWSVVLESPQQIILSQNQPENQNTNDVWCKTNATDNSFEIYVKQSDSTYLQRYVKTKADYVVCDDGQSVEEKVGNIATDITDAISIHNIDEIAHQDMRDEISGISETIITLSSNASNGLARDLNIMLNLSLSTTNIDAWADLLSDEAAINTASSDSYRLANGEITAAISETNTTTTYGLGSTASNEMAASIFTAPSSGSISKVTFRMRKVGSPTDNVMARIYSVSGWLPSEMLYSSSAISGASLSTSMAECDFTFSGANLTAGVQYAIVFDRLLSGYDGSNYYECTVSTNTDGIQLFRYNGSAWSLYAASYSLYFVLTGLPATIEWNAVVSTGTLGKICIAADQTLNSGAANYYVSDDGLTWTQVTSLNEAQDVTFSGTNVYLKCVISGDAVLNAVAWGGY